MEKQEYKTLLTYNYSKFDDDENNNKLFLCGHDLKELANMDSDSVPKFFEIVKESTNRNKKTDWRLIITPQSKTSTDNLTFELEVPVNKYEEYKRLIFDLAYIGCSKTVVELHENNIYKQMGYSSSEKPFMAVSFGETFLKKRILHTIKFCNHIGNGEYTLYESNIPVDEADYEERYNKLNEPIKIKEDGKQLVKSTKQTIQNQ